MMLSFKNNRVAPIFIFIVLVLVSCAAQTPNKQIRVTTADPKADFEKLCVLLTPKTESASDDLIRQWRKDVQERTTYTVEDHIAVIESLQKEQVELKKQFDQCDAQATASTRNYSSQWFTDLKNKFGLGYLKENKKDVFMCLAAMVSLPTDHYCSTTQEKMVINQETLALAYERYCDYFNGFYDRLQKEQKRLLADQHKQAQTLLDSIKHEINFVVTLQIINTKLAEERAMRFNKELYLYMKNDLNMMAVDPLKALDDFKRFVGD